MDNAPRVQTLAESMAMLEPGFSEQRGLINEQMGMVDTQADITRQRLEGSKTKAFTQINEQAARRGVGAAFSGIPIDKQTTYLADTFLPGMQQVELDATKERMQLRGQVADLNMQLRTSALSRVDQQQSALNQWNLAQAQIEAQRREAELQRQFTAEQSRLDREFQAGQNAANRAAQAAASRPDLYADISAVFRETWGKDKYVHPTNYAQQKAFAGEYGMSGAEFDKKFAHFRNPKDTGYKLG